MTVLQAKTTIAAGADGAWVSADGYTDIVVSVSAGTHRVEAKMSETGTVASTETYRGKARDTVVAKAFKLRVVNDGEASVEYEVIV